MPLRRHVLRAAAAVALGATRVPRLFAAKYDLHIRGGRVIDPAARRDGLADVATSGGRIAAIARDLPASDAAEVLDARGLLVTPGRIDRHVHADADMPPAHCLSTVPVARASAPGRRGPA